MKRTLLLLAMPLMLLNAWGAELASPNAKNDEEETPWVIEKEGKNLMEVRINSQGFIWVKNPSYNEFVNSIQEVGTLTKAFIQSLPKEHIITIGTKDIYEENAKNAKQAPPKIINEVKKEIGNAYQELRNDLAKQKYGKSFSKLDADKKGKILAYYPYHVLRMKNSNIDIDYQLAPPPMVLPVTPEVLDIVKDEDEMSEEYEDNIYEEVYKTLSMTGECSEIIITEDNSINNSSDAEDDDKIFDLPEEYAEFPGDLFAWLSKNIKYPPICQEKKIQGRVRVQFIINEDGSISNERVLRSPDENLSKEACRVVKAMPKWKAAREGNKLVRMSYVIPIIFKLSSSPSQQK